MTWRAHVRYSLAIPGSGSRRPTGWMRSSICTQKNPPAQAAPKRRVIYQVFWCASILGHTKTACKSDFSSRLKAKSARTPVDGATSGHGAARQGRAGSDRGRPGAPHPRTRVADSGAVRPFGRAAPPRPAPTHAHLGPQGRAAPRAPRPSHPLTSRGTS